jgi:uncharacterized PurR-regulated membrane protein YhhQ (DUF165 family)
VTRAIAAVALGVYVGAIVLANWLIVHVGLVAVGFGLVAPAGVYMAALTFPARDVLQRASGRLVGLLAIVVGAAVSWVVASPTIAVASGVTFLISESIDMAVYTPLQRRWFVVGVVASGIVAATVDSLVFLQLSGIGYGPGGSILRGLIVGKLWIVTLIGGPVAYVLRRRLPQRESLLPA